VIFGFVSYVVYLILLSLSVISLIMTCFSFDVIFLCLKSYPKTVSKFQIATTWFPRSPPDLN